MRGGVRIPIVISVDIKSINIGSISIEIVGRCTDSTERISIRVIYKIKPKIISRLTTLDVDEYRTGI
jgi:hypothetical protein